MSAARCWVFAVEAAAFADRPRPNGLPQSGQSLKLHIIARSAMAVIKRTREATMPGLRRTMVETAVIMGFPVQG